VTAGRAARKKPGRPRLAIDPTLVEAMAFVGGSDREIADYFGCDRSTIAKRFSRILTKARAGQRVRLRQKQYEVAMAGNPTILIWLGKQMLGQADQSKVQIGDLDALTDQQLEALAAGRDVS